MNVLDISPKMQLGRLFPVVFSLIVFFLAECRPPEEMALVRFMDILERSNIAESPFLKSEADPESFRQTRPVLAEVADKWPLLDLGVKRNPFLLKKKVVIGPTEQNILLAPPKSVYEFKVKIPGRGVLEFFYGIMREVGPSRLNSDFRSVEFSVQLSARGKRVQLFGKQLTHPFEKVLVFDHKRIDLSAYSGQNVTLYFVTQGTRDALACWFNPYLFVPKPKPTTVVLISLDTLRADHLGCYGYPRETSPHMDALVEDATLFRNVFAPSPWTIPSHVSMLTGLDCVNHRVTQPSHRMDPAVRTLADHLRRAGYHTAGLTGGGFVSGLYGLSKGFDSYRVIGRLQAPDSAAVLAQSATAWIMDNREQSFFLFLHTYQIHNPYMLPEPSNRLFLDKDAAHTEFDFSPLRYNHQNRYKPVTDALRRNIIGLYDAEIRYTDEALVGPVIEKLQELGLYENTLLIVTSDHGEEFFEHGSWQHTNNVYNETIKVPLIIKFPGSRAAGTRVDRYARLVDIMPTILDEVGVNIAADDVDGRSLLGLMGDGKPGEERMFRSVLESDVLSNHIPRKMTLNQGSIKVILNDSYTPEMLAFFWAPPPELERLEIYDLTNDPGERRNLALIRPEKARRLLAYLEKNSNPTRKGTVLPSEAMEKIREELKSLGYIN